MIKLPENILFFDGYCGLCNELVDWMITHDKSETIFFASLQGETASRALPPEVIQKMDTVIYLRKNQTHVQSEAILYALLDMGYPKFLIQIFLFIPRFVRDFIYRIIAKNRYKFFRRLEHCRLPTASDRQKILP